jgi:DNA primase
VRKAQLLKEAIGPYYRSGDELLFACPFCEHYKNKLSINLKKNKFKCWVCDTSGNSLLYLFKRFGNVQQLTEWKKLNNITDFSEVHDQLDHLFDEPEEKTLPKLRLPKEFISLANRGLPLSSTSAKSYLKKRRIDKRDILYWKIGYCPKGHYAGRLIIPSFDLDGNVNYFIARSYSGNWKKYLNPEVPKGEIIFNELCVDFAKPVTLVEGVFDAIVAGENSIPILGSTLREGSRLFQKIIENNSTIYMALDPDATSKTNSIIEKLLHYGLKAYIIDVSGFKDVGEMTKEEFATRKENATQITDNLSLLFTNVKF